MIVKMAAITFGLVDFWRATIFLSQNLCTEPVVITTILAAKSDIWRYWIRHSARRAAEQSQVGYQGPGEPENMQRVERGAVREDHFCFQEIEVPKNKNIVLIKY